MHAAVRRFFEYNVSADEKIVLEIGGADINGGLRDLLPGGAVYTSIDVKEGPGVDVVANAAEYVHPEPLDAVWCAEVLEHTHLWREIVSNVARLLQPGGRLLMTCAGPGRAPHGAWGANDPGPGEFYENLDPNELQDVMDEAFEKVEIWQVGLDLQAIGTK